jgi:hypothetical protein
MDADAEQWAQHLAEKHAADAPVLVMEQVRVKDLGERQVDAAGMAGVTFTTSEFRPPGHPSGARVPARHPDRGQRWAAALRTCEGAVVVEAVVEGNAVYCLGLAA